MHLIGHFYPSKYLIKVENIQKRSLRYLHKDFISDEFVLNELNPSFIKELFTMRKGTYKLKIDLILPARKSVTPGDKNNEI